MTRNMANKFVDRYGRLKQWSPCPHCQVMHPATILTVHEELCIRNPNIVLLRSLGKTFVSKPEYPGPKSAPPIRVAAITYLDGRVYPILQDDVMDLYSSNRLERLGSYRGGGFQTQCFRIRSTLVMPDEDTCLFYELVWNAILKARKAGAEL